MQGYPSDLTDEQWAFIEPLLPTPRTGVRGGRREKHPRGQIVDAILYGATCPTTSYQLRGITRRRMRLVSCGVPVI